MGRKILLGNVGLRHIRIKTHDGIIKGDGLGQKGNQLPNGPESLISHSTSSTHNSVDAETKAKTGVTDSLLRLSVGLEACEDIQRDLAEALLQSN